MYKIVKKVITLFVTIISLSSCNTAKSSNNHDSNSNNGLVNSNVGGSYSSISTHVEHYTITWVNWDGIVLEIDSNVEEGTLPSYDGNLPTKEGNKEYSYSFVGWSPSVVAATSDATYTAQFSSSINGYTIIWKNWDGTILEIDSSVLYGTDPSYDGEIPTKKSNDQYSYSFRGWSPELNKVTDNVTYIAQFNDAINTYTVTWVNWDGTILEIDYDVPYGTMPSYNSDTPLKSSDVQYSYAFSGWSPSISEVHRDITYIAQFQNNTQCYTVVWKNWDDSVLEIDANVPYGSIPSYNGTTPTKVGSAQYSYTFSGWSPSVVQVTGDATYVAQFSFDEFNTFSIQYMILECNNPNETIVREGATIVLKPASKLGYDFIGWYLDCNFETKPVTKISNINSDYTLYGKFELHDYQIIYHLDGGRNDSANPLFIKITDNIILNPAQKTGYTFAGWYFDEGCSVSCNVLQNTSCDIDIYAAFKANKYSYTLNYQSFENNIAINFHYYYPNSAEVYTRLYSVGSSISYADLARASSNDYAFAGWYYDETFENMFNCDITITEPLDLYGKWVKHSDLGDYDKSQYEDLTNFKISLNVYDSESSWKVTKKFFVPFNAIVVISDCWASHESIFDFYNVSSGKHKYIHGIYYMHLDDKYTSEALAYVKLDAGAYEMTFSDSGLFSSTVFYSCKAKIERIYTITSKITLSTEFTYQIDYDSEMNLPVLSRKGYEFLGWQDQNGNIVSGQYKYDSNLNLSVKWSEPIQYKIVYDLDGGLFEDEQPISYTINDNYVTLGTPVKTGYDFLGFYDDNGNKILRIYGSTCKDYYLTARWSLKNIYIRYDFNGGYYAKNVDFESDGTVISSQAIDPYTSLQFFVPEQKNGYQFVGWKVKGFSKYYSFSGALEGPYATVLQAQWNPIKEGCLGASINSNIEDIPICGYNTVYYQITSLIDQEIVVSSSGNIDVCGTLFDYSLNQLATNDDISESNNNFEITYSLKANTSYIIGVRGSTDDTSGITNISIKSNSETIYPISSATGKIWASTYLNGYSYFNYGNKIVLPPPPSRLGYRFVGWFDENDNEYHDGDLVNFEKSITLIAKWEELNT